LNIYDLSGRFVKKLIEAQQEQGQHHVTWDGTDAGGNVIASGIYSYRLQAGDQTAVRKMAILK